MEVLIADRLLNAQEVAELLAVPVSWVRETTRTGAMPVVELGRYRRYDRDDVLEWVASCKSGGRYRRTRSTRRTAREGGSHSTRAAVIVYDGKRGRMVRVKYVDADITRDAAAGATPIAVMTKAGHASMTTTKRYLHLAGTVFRDEADRLEERYGLKLDPVS